ncbi:hypothetical protein OJ253_35 [Cryptosporidium canis]|uniref:Uncharacterized protein n=1 Tax=Cryptosporidium canis TaxID=195482 RepID=A0A9D5DJL4_9CRYT|nr:hypothetical protein OJ253_35 [Cryptosporidium canis]
MKADTESSQALYNKAFYVWHEDFLKNSDTTVNSSPQPLAFVCNVDIIDLSSSETFAGFVTDQGYLYCWLWPKTINGRNDIKINPTAITCVEESVNNLSCGNNHISCVTETNTLYIWIFGQESINSNELSLKSISNPTILRNWKFPIKKIKSGSNHVLVLLSNNDLYCVKLPEQSEFKETHISELATTKINVPEKIIEIQAGTNISTYLCENNLYFQRLSDKYHLNSNIEQCSIQRVDTDDIIQSHTCNNEACSYKISNARLYKDIIALGVIFDCEVAQYHDAITSDYFSHIFIYSFEQKIISLAKYSDQSNFFKSFHWLNDHICAIFSDDTIWFRDKSSLMDEEQDIVIRPKGDTKLFFASANGKCLIINISQNMFDNSPTSNTENDKIDSGEIGFETKIENNIEGTSETLVHKNDAHIGSSIDSNKDCPKIDQKCDELDSTKEFNQAEVSNCFPSNTTFEASEADGETARNEFGEYTTLEEIKINDDLPSYQRPTISSIITKKPQRHTFLRKGEGKIRAYKSTSSEKSESKLPSNIINNKLESNNINSIRSNPVNSITNKKKLQEYETRIFNLESENRRIMDILQETKKRYLSDVKTLYNQLKERSDEKFPLKSVVEQLQRELFVEREEKSKLKEDYDSVKLQLQNEICNKNIKRDLLNAQLVIERDRLSKEKEEIEGLYQELSNKSTNLEILVSELSSKYNKLEQDHGNLTVKYDEIDQMHTLTVNQLSKSELELYELRKELDLNKANKNTSVNELYEYINELENSLKDLKTKNETSANKNVNVELSNLPVPNPKENCEINKVKEYIIEKMNALKDNKLVGLSHHKSLQSNSPIYTIVDDIFNIFIEKINASQEKNNVLKRKVNILENCIKVRKDDINVLFEGHDLKNDKRQI